MQDIVKNYKLHVDLDGVLVDFVKGTIKMFEIVLPGESIDHSTIKYETDPEYRAKLWAACATYQQQGGEMWYDSPLMEDAWHLWDYITPYSPQILSATGPPKYKAEDQKRRWVAKMLGEDVIVNVTRKAVEKSRHAAPQHILIDDKEKAIKPWIEHGGIGILHTSAVNTIIQLKTLGL